MHAPILVDVDGNAFFKCLSSLDSRTMKLVEEVGKKSGIPQPYFTSTALKILWIKRQYPEILEKTYKVLLPKDFIRMKLSSTFCTNQNDANGISNWN